MLSAKTVETGSRYEYNHIVDNVSSVDLAMESKKCRKCGLVNFAGNDVCARCKAPITVSIPVEVLSPTNEPITQRSRFACPNCRSEDVKSFSVIYGDGTKLGGSGKTSSVSALLVHPPEEARNSDAALTAVVLMVVFGAVWALTSLGALISFFTAVIMAIIFWLAMVPIRRNRKEKHILELEEWGMQMMCQRCGDAFRP